MSDVTASGDWYFIHEDLTTQKTIIYPVAVWSRQSNDDMIGLIGGVETKDQENHVKNRLVPPPPVEGMYIKRSKVNSELIDRALQNRFVEYQKLREL